MADSSLFKDAIINIQDLLDSANIDFPNFVFDYDFSDQYWDRAEAKQKIRDWFTKYFGEKK